MHIYRVMTSKNESPYMITISSSFHSTEEKAEKAFKEQLDSLCAFGWVLEKSQYKENRVRFLEKTDQETGKVYNRTVVLHEILLDA